MTDRVSKLKSYQFLKFSTYITAQKVPLFGVILVIEQMVEEADAGSKTNDSRELFNIVKKLYGKSSKTSSSSVNKQNGKPLSSFPDLLDEWGEYFKELLNINSALCMEEIPVAEYDLNININDFTFYKVSKTVKNIRTVKPPQKDLNVTAEALNPLMHNVPK